MEPRPSAPGERPLVEWRQQAGFSVFFDLARDDSGGEIWQVRLYHEESAEEAVVVEVVSEQLIERQHRRGDAEDARIDAVVRLTGLSELLRSVGGAIMDAALRHDAKHD